MEVVIRPTTESAVKLTAAILADAVRAKPNLVLGLATGSTPIGAYKQLIEWHKQGDLSFSEVRSVNLDEYFGLAPDDIDIKMGTLSKAFGTCGGYIEGVHAVEHGDFDGIIRSADGFV